MNYISELKKSSWHIDLVQDYQKHSHGQDECSMTWTWDEVYLLKILKNV